MRFALPKIRRPRLLTRLARNRRGAAAVEFALVSIPFLALTFGIVEIGMIFFMSTWLESATNDTARLIRTGQMGSTATASTFVTDVCQDLSWLGTSCSSNLYVDVRTFSSFSGMTAPSPIQSGQIKQTNLTFSVGNAGDIVLVRTFYTWTLFAPMLDGMGAQPLSNGQYLLTSTAAFRNEPY